MNDILFEFKGDTYPRYLCDGNAMQYIAPIAHKFCIGRGLDVGAGKWPLPGAIPVDISNGGDAHSLPDGQYQFVFSSHCLEHLPDTVAAIEHWKSRIQSGGVLFLYLPHPSQKYWRPSGGCRKHLHLFYPADVADMLRDLGFVDVIHGERDLAWSFACVGWAP